MIGLLRGTISLIDREKLIIMTSGVGYEVYASPSLISELPKDGNEAELYIYTDVKENDIQLFGFRNLIEKKIFLFLKKVKGIGSKLAITILSSIESQKLLYAIATSDFEVLTKVPGVGKKSAERIIVELREQVQEFVNQSNLELSNNNFKISSIDIPSKINKSNLSIEVVKDATMALIALGFKEEAIHVALDSVLEDSQIDKTTADPGEIVKKALAYFL